MSKTVLKQQTCQSAVKVSSNPFCSLEIFHRDTKLLNAIPSGWHNKISTLTLLTELTRTPSFADSAAQFEHTVASRIDGVAT
jgi:hypothetical protein